MTQRNARFFGVLAVAMLAFGTAACRSVPSIHPEAIRHNSEGAELLAEGKLDDAEARFRLALEYNPGFPEPRANLGIIYLQRGDLKNAEENLRSALKLNENFSEAWSNLGVVLEREGGRDDEAIAAYEKALSIEPALLHTRKNLAVVLIRHERFGPARAQLMRLVQLDKDDTVAQALLAYAELRLDRPNAAKERADEVLQDHPGDPVASVVRGILYAHDGDLDHATQSLLLGVDDPTVGTAAKLRLAGIYVEQQQNDLAQPLVDELLKIGPDDAAVNLIAGGLALNKDDWQHARDYAAAALRTHPGLKEASDLLHRACADHGGVQCERKASPSKHR